MSDELREYVAEHTGTSRRAFLTKLIVGSAFVVPVVASFTMGGGSAFPAPSGAVGSNLREKTPANGGRPGPRPRGCPPLGSNITQPFASNVVCPPVTIPVNPDKP